MSIVNNFIYNGVGFVNKFKFFTVCTALAFSLCLPSDVFAAETVGSSSPAAQAKVTQSQNSTEHAVNDEFKQVVQLIHEGKFEEAISPLTKLAESGYADAQQLLAQCYYKGEGVECNMSKALFWLKKAAEQGRSDAEYKVGCIFDQDKVGPRNPKEAMLWYERSAKQGHVAAQLMAGLHYMNGDGVERSPETAVQYYVKAADKGHPFAQFLLGDCYVYGHGVTKDAVKAIGYYTKAAENGYIDAQIKLGIVYNTGLEDLQPDLEKAAYWLTKAAERGVPDAKFLLGVSYQHGRGVKADGSKALELYKEAAASGSPISGRALRCIALCLYKGVGTEANAAEAVTYLRQAADYDDKVAQSCLAYCLLNGIGVEKDAEEAADWLKESGFDKPLDPAKAN
ncbi:MAG: tetratricopeptide repeat protein [Candidatus Bruticola sp.]